MNPQLEKWAGQFGSEYTKRNDNPDLYRKRIGTFKGIVEKFPSPLTLFPRVLEIGCNVGTNLRSFWGIVPTGHFVGVEPNEKARRAAEMRGFRVYSDEGQDLQFLDGSFDLVFTCGVLIHIKDFRPVVKEMVRVSSQYLLFMEYFSPTEEQVSYRGNDEMLWKRDWPTVLLPILGLPLAEGFAGKAQGFDDVSWYLYEKPREVRRDG